MKRVFQRLPDLFQPDRRPSARSIRKSSMAASCRQPPSLLKRDGIGIFGDHLQAEIFEDRQRGRQRQHLAQHIELEPQRRRGVAFLARDARALSAPSFGRGKVSPARPDRAAAHGRENCRDNPARNAGPARVKPAQSPRCGPGWRTSLPPGRRPRSDGWRDLPFQLAHVDLGQRAFIAADDVMEPHQRAVVRPPASKADMRPLKALASMAWMSCAAWR